MVYMFILLFIILILIIPLNLKIFLHNNTLNINITVLNSFNINLIKDKKILDFDNSSKSKKKSKSHDKISTYDIFKILTRFFNMSFDVYFKFGFERRDLTALLYGGLSSIFPILEAYFKKNYSINKFTYKLYPNFKNEIFNIKVISNIKTNMFNIILIIFILLKEKLYIRKKYKTKQKEC